MLKFQSDEKKGIGPSILIRTTRPERGFCSTILVNKCLMYQFNIVKNEDNSWGLELGGIHLIVDGFEIRGQRHWITSPGKTIAYFNIKGFLYGLANQNQRYRTAEEFYELMREQYAYFAER